ncbi:MIP/aquaporin family protein [Bifidobacterium leontopitheci]|uniref:Membrane channel n=1 Tax=Bifidobacterium leontopitheci TaxID=2650774 RepID=A0A6I1GGL5_9BIFI|nr:aquaporin [Bifidobacterium leontopitheci]KAB7790770.1 membrane channel [Bifidobacterium leontopitheci]
MTEEHRNEDRTTFALPLRVAAELAGSFLVCFTIYMICTFGTAIYGLDLAFIAVGTAFAYFAVTVALGAISGGQLNPAVTVAAMLTGRTKVLDGILYVVAQVLGAIAAGGLLKWILPTSDKVTIKTWLTPVVNGFDAGSVSNATTSQASVSFGINLAIIVEVIASIIIIAAAMRTTDRSGRPDHSYAPAVGAAYGVGVAMTYTITGSALNPARATGIAIFAQNQKLSAEPLQQLWIFWVASILAAAIVALVMIIADMSSKHTAKKPASADSAVDATVESDDQAADEPAQIADAEASSEESEDSAADSSQDATPDDDEKKD